METPLVSPFAELFTNAEPRAFRVGDLVVNLGVGARVIEVTDIGLVLRETVPLGPIPAGWTQAKWLADPAKCRLAY